MRRASAEPARFSGVGAPVDRRKAFRAARRHSAFVKVLRVLFPVMALGVASLYFLPSEMVIETDAGRASVDSIDISDGGLKMMNPRLQGVHEKHGAYDIRADHATQRVDDPSLITLNTIQGELTAQDGKKTVLKAPSGIFHSKKEELIFNNGLSIAGEAGFRGKLQTATAFFRSNKLVSKDPVDLGFHGSTIKASSMTFHSSEARAIFEGNVRVHLERTQGDKTQ